MNLNRGLGLAAALLLAGSGTAALAHPHPDGDGKSVERIIVVRDGKGGDDQGSPDRIPRFEMLGAGGLANCDGGEKIVDELLAAIAIGQVAGSQHLEPSDPVGRTLLVPAFAVTDDDDPLDRLAVAVRMGMGERGGSGSGEEECGGEAEAAVELHLIILPSRASGC
ncbi:MAG TPA: hypothetical protein VF652_01050 [Allosphingosinicella sp.]